MTKKPTKSQVSQSNRFIDKARELGCDEDEAAFDAKLKTVAGQKPRTSDSGLSKKRTRRSSGQSNG